MTTIHTYQPLCKDPFGNFETESMEKHKLLMLEEMGAEIDRRDLHLFNATSRICPSCSGRMYSHGRASPCTYIALCGELQVRLRRLRCQGCGSILVPSASLLPDNGISASLAERICDLASKMSYEKATESLWIQHRISLSVTTVWNSVQKESSNFDDILKKQAQDLYKHGVYPEDCLDLKGEKPLIIGIDGGFVKKWKQKESFEIKCATIATGSSLVSKNSKKRKLDNRVGYSAKCTVDEFRQRISVLALKAGYSTASNKIFVTDGATWIGNMIAEYFPDAIHVLDMYHLKNKVKSLFGLSAFGLDAELLQDTLSACDSYNPRLIYDTISSWYPDDAKKQDDKSSLLEYVINNRQAILNHNHVSIHGSGWVEKAVDLMVSRRLKSRGMGWSFSGCSNLLPLTVLQYNKQWNLYWHNRKGLSPLTA